MRPGFEETEENLTNLMESRLQDHERIRGGLYFIQNIPRDENWKVRRDILAAYEPQKSEDCTLNVSAALPTSNETKTKANDLATQVAESPKLAKKVVQELERQPNGSYVAPVTQPIMPEAVSPRTKRSASACASTAKRPQDSPQVLKFEFLANQILIVYF